MHDTPARMLAVGVLRGIVPWRRARAFFVDRLRRRWVVASEGVITLNGNVLDFACKHAA